MDFSTILGLIVGIGSLILAFVLEGGRLGALIVGTAALIVFGGTIGATIISFHIEDVAKMPILLAKAFKRTYIDENSIFKKILDMAEIARREGLLSLEQASINEPDDFFKKGLRLIVDGVDINLSRDMLELDIYTLEQENRRLIRMFEAAGGYAPTMGIIGTVMGLIHVLSNLADPSSLGPSIAVAFIATFYGVSSANIFWLPIAEKLKLNLEKEKRLKEMILEGVLSISQGENPRLISEKLSIFMKSSKDKTNQNPALNQSAEVK